ncbi:hypothetical protein [Microlunatus flavus]|uniref:Uncharacterized protein n=1 Tax=Microlunatus flavus TaxID=1036181 RepID=A0A1H9CUL5_9ACTN|nr:hypothetical protein [Microlunatus flavus]SEQ04777.1 hypothetical protein SAMN05421756_102330 [Microlunatus flavus]
MTASLVPLDITLFGWPEVPTTSPLAELGLLIGIPLVVILVVIAVSQGNKMMHESRRGPGPHADDPVWMGGRARSIMGGADDELPAITEGERRALEGSSASGSSSATTSATSESDAGGASARW